MGDQWTGRVFDLDSKMMLQPMQGLWGNLLYCI
jgi:hypothetical protein